MSVTAVTHSNITAIAPLKANAAAQLKQTLAALSTSATSPIAQISTIHFARWVLIDNETRLLFAVDFDGDWNDYLDEFIAKAPDGLDAIFGACEGYPAGGARDADAFKAYVKAHQYDAELSYCAYPDATVKDVAAGLRIRKNFDAILEEFQ